MKSGTFIATNVLTQIILYILLLSGITAFAVKIIEAKAEIHTESSSLNSFYDLAILYDISPNVIGELKYDAQVDWEYFLIVGQAKPPDMKNISYVDFMFGVSKGVAAWYDPILFTIYIGTDVLLTKKIPGLKAKVIFNALAGLGFGIFSRLRGYTLRDVLNPRAGWETLQGWKIALWDKKAIGTWHWLERKFGECKFPHEQYYVKFPEEKKIILSSLDQGAEHVEYIDTGAFIPITKLPAFIYPEMYLSEGFGGYFEQGSKTCEEGWIQSPGERAMDQCQEKCDYWILHLLKNIRKIEFLKYDKIMVNSYQNIIRYHYVTNLSVSSEAPEYDYNKLSQNVHQMSFMPLGN